MTEDGYQGYKNHETWHTALVIDNEQPSQEEALRLAQEALDEAPADRNVRDEIWTVEQTARYRLADILKSWVEEQLPELDESYHAQAYMRAGFEAVDWHELADHYLATLAEERQHA